MVERIRAHTCSAASGDPDDVTAWLCADLDRDLHSLSMTPSTGVSVAGCRSLPGVSVVALQNRSRTPSKGVMPGEELQSFGRGRQRALY